MLEDPEVGGKLSTNVIHFAGVLRRAGLPVGSGQVLDAIAALDAVGLGSRDDVRAALEAVFVSRAEHLELFAEAFALFWRDPFGGEELMSLLLPRSEVARGMARTPPRRVQEAMGRKRPLAREPEPELILDASGTASGLEVLRARDFEQMSAEELAQARRILARTRFPWRDRPTRRLRPHPRGRVPDLRRTLRAAMRTGRVPMYVHGRTRHRRPPPLVVLCDISGSMERYSRMFLRFVHALTNDRDRVHTFLFGTRLTPVTRMLRGRDIDRCLARLGREVEDWSGGTRIAASLRAFNFQWSRRVLGQGAVVLLVTDGLERELDGTLEIEAERLHRMSRRLIWLNPLLRWEGFEPLAAGVKALLPHVDELRAVHNLRSFAELALVLSERRPSKVSPPRGPERRGPLTLPGTMRPTD